MVNGWYVGTLVWVFANIWACSTSPAVDTCSSITLTTPASGKPKTVALSIPSQFTAGTEGYNLELENPQVVGSSSQKENAAPFFAFSVPFIEHQNLIVDVIKHSRAHVRQVFIPSRTDLRWKLPMQVGMTGLEFLAQYGLQPAPTPATGNCQYYAIAMSLLDMQFDTSKHIKSLEQMTQYLKKGIEQASRHAYGVEFPHDIRQAILVSTQLDIDGQELTVPETEEESDLLFQQYIHNIAQSPSSISTYLPAELWGTEVTLRMMAKVLQQPVFVIIAPRGLQAAPDFQVYQPERVTKGGCQFDTAEEYYIAQSESEQWLSRLQQVCRGPNSTLNPPIVLLYSNFHYSRVQFVPLGYR